MLGHNQSQALLDGYFPFNPFHKGIDFAAYQRSDQDYYGRINGCPAPSAIELYQWQMAKKINDAKWKVIAGIGSFVQGGIDAITGTVDGVMDIAKNIREGNIEELPSFLTNNPEKARKEAQALIDEFNESVINGDTDSRLNYAGGIIIPSLLSAGIGKGLQLVLKRAPKVPKPPKSEPIPSKVDDITSNVDEHLKPNQDKPLDNAGTGKDAESPRTGEEWDEYFRSKYSDDNVTWVTKNNFEYVGGFDDHLINAQSIVRKGNKGIVGGHNLDSFEKILTDQGWNLDDLIVSKTPHSTISGVYQIHYRLPALDRELNVIPDQYKNISHPKTVYDPSVISNDQIIQWGKEAMANGKIVGREIRGTASNGLKFTGYLDENGKVTNFFPTISE
ncbi:CdiA family toxin C-terminal domain-containing protein [Paenibacillus sinopodophylli]|uniref:CdiA family toxin C-terminal domain-containing protein n=1 Tax=Paenibacillus sinopodophylli TaxID=1837342 RepID=UPI001FE85E93|nr:CdiA family toxin C-terminal domain-containing protein [Paenibacillus sinopodophylli]